MREIGTSTSPPQQACKACVGGGRSVAPVIYLLF